MNRPVVQECPLMTDGRHQWGLIGLLQQIKALRRKIQDEGDDLYAFENRNLLDWTEERDLTDEQREEQRWVRQASRDRKELVQKLNAQAIRAL